MIALDNFSAEKIMCADALNIINSALASANPYDAVFRAIKNKLYEKPPHVIAIGKAAAVMAEAAYNALSAKIAHGVILTKYAHSERAPEGFDIYEAGHPEPDDNSCVAAERILELTAKLDDDDTVILLLSGGGSALFEKPLLPLSRVAEITRLLLRGGASINELNCVRKRLSAVKGGRFALHCAPAKIEVYALSDVLGDRADVIASGPAAPDGSTSAEARAVIEKYALSLHEDEIKLIDTETPKALDNVSMELVGNLAILCGAARDKARELGYDASILSTAQEGEARVLGATLAKAAKRIKSERPGEKVALIIGGETTVNAKGSGKGGRNQEIALSAAKQLDGESGIVIFSIGSDGTDGPTDAAGGLADGYTAMMLRSKGISINAELNNNNAYYALEQCGRLIVTGPTGTNVNDLTVALIMP